jgi:hypothetical protein
MLTSVMVPSKTKKMLSRHPTNEEEHMRGHDVMHNTIVLPNHRTDTLKRS